MEACLGLFEVVSSLGLQTPWLPLCGFVYLSSNAANLYAAQSMAWWEPKDATMAQLRTVAFCFGKENV